jgi:hypothetical protein
MKTGSKWWVLFASAVSSVAGNLASGQLVTEPLKFPGQALIDKYVPAEDSSRYDNIMFFSCVIGALILVVILGMIIWRKRRGVSE